MTKKLVALLGCVAWAGAVISSAVPADAFAITTQVGDYGNCSAENEYYPKSNECTDDGEPLIMPVTTNYIQQIKFITTACGASQCNSDPDAVYVDNVYIAGRKQVQPDQHLSCTSGFFYTLGACAC